MSEPKVGDLVMNSYDAIGMIIKITSVQNLYIIEFYDEYLDKNPPIMYSRYQTARFVERYKSWKTKILSSASL